MKTIKIEVNAACVTEVTGLPEGYDYEIIDHDIQEEEDEKNENEWSIKNYRRLTEQTV